MLKWPKLPKSPMSRSNVTEERKLIKQEENEEEPDDWYVRKDSFTRSGCLTTPLKGEENL